eukprot:GHVU01025344.1.p2 GENE.GHVU01025344.1~~GHVU01025344.1.p2  ORF type:complete len:109 (-),score=6.28 GHVU01025344.1:677-1003(-)
MNNSSNKNNNNHSNGNNSACHNNDNLDSSGEKSLRIDLNRRFGVNRIGLLSGLRKSACRPAFVNRIDSKSIDKNLDLVNPMRFRWTGWTSRPVMGFPWCRRRRIQQIR